MVDKSTVPSTGEFFSRISGCHRMNHHRLHRGFRSFAGSWLSGDRAGKASKPTHWVVNLKVSWGFPGWIRDPYLEDHPRSFFVSG